MADVAMISSLLTSVKAAADLAKLLKDSSHSLEEAETKLKFADLVSALADTKVEAAGIQDLLLEKDRRIKELEEALRTHGNLVYEKPCYWIVEGELREGPYCQRCYDVDRLLIRLQDGANDVWHCRACEKFFSGPNFRSRRVEQPRPGGFSRHSL